MDPPDGNVAVAGVKVTATLAGFETAICKDCCLDSPLESATEMAKLKLPVAVGVPTIVPAESPRTTPGGS